MIGCPALSTKELKLALANLKGRFALRDRALVKRPRGMNNELARSQANDRDHSTLVATHQVEGEPFDPEVPGDELHAL